MKTNIIKEIYIYIVSILLTAHIYSVEKKPDCQADLEISKGHEFVLIPSAKGHDDEMIVKFNKFVNKMSKSGGVLDQLGIPRTKQVLEFLSGVDMRVLTSTATSKPVAHFNDGAQILNALGNPRGIVYEVVFPGPKYQYGYYRDDNPFEWQLSIISHVVGHNHFATKSFFPHYRVAQTTEAAARIDKVLRDAYLKNDKIEVENYYMFLQTLMSLEDYHSTFYQSPDVFNLPKVPKTLDDYQVKLHQNVIQNGLVAPTENVLQAFVNRLENSEAEQWKIDLAREIPNVGPYRPALVVTQVMNEGWASIMQEIVMSHMGDEYNTMNHWLDALHVMHTTDRLDITNPYWLGVRGWHRLKERFFQRPEIEKLATLLEKDRAFIKYAEEEIISKMDDYAFINLAFDDTAILKLKLAITRKADYIEASKLPKPPPDIENPQPIIVVTKSPDRIRRRLIEVAVKNKTQFRPRVQLSSFNRMATGEIELKVVGEIGRQVPIDKNTIGPALYALSNIMNQPVSFEALFDQTDSSDDQYFKNIIGDYTNPAFNSDTGEYIIIEKHRLVVNSAGNFDIYKISEKNGKYVEERLDGKSELYQIIAASIKSNIEEFYMESDEKLSILIENNPAFDKIANESINSMINKHSLTTLVDHAPAAANAITEYRNKVAARIIQAMQKAMNGGGGLVNTSKGMFLKALPRVHNISFDNDYINKLQGVAKPADIGQALIKSDKNPFDGDSSGDIIGPTDLGPGDGGWRPGPGGGGGSGNGNGKGEPGDGEPGDPGDDPGGVQPGDVGLDPSWIPIPPDLYAQFLGEKVQLPNLNPKKGGIRSKKSKLKRQMNRKHGQMLVYDTNVNALNKGIGAQIADGIDPLDPSIPLIDTLVKGYGLMRPNDYVVKKGKLVKKPDTNAVVIFARDASGSTMAYGELYRRFVFDMKTLIKANYSKVKFEYIIFDTQAYIMKTEAEFFKAALGGGTDYGAGVKKVRELMKEKYPIAKFDRFPFIIGDMGDNYNDNTAEQFSAMIEEAAYSGTVKGGYGVDDFDKAMQALASDHKYYGYVDLGNDPKGYEIEHIRKLLKNDEYGDDN